MVFYAAVVVGGLEGEVLAGIGCGECEVAEADEGVNDVAVSVEVEVEGFGIDLLGGDALGALHGEHAGGSREVALAEGEDALAAVLHVHEVEHVQIGSLPAQVIHVGIVVGSHIEFAAVELDGGGRHVEFVGGVESGGEKVGIGCGEEGLHCLELTVLAHFCDEGRQYVFALDGAFHTVGAGVFHFVGEGACCIEGSVFVNCHG